jgi:hypothetical protein
MGLSHAGGHAGHVKAYHNLGRELCRKSRSTSLLLNVRFGSLADIVPCQRDVRFTPESGHDEVLRVEWVSQIAKSKACLAGTVRVAPSAKVN